MNDYGLNSFGLLGGLRRSTAYETYSVRSDTTAYPTGNIPMTVNGINYGQIIFSDISLYPYYYDASEAPMILAGDKNLAYSLYRFVTLNETHPTLIATASLAYHGVSPTGNYVRQIPATISVQARESYIGVSTDQFGIQGWNNTGLKTYDSRYKEFIPVGVASYTFTSTSGDNWNSQALDHPVACSEAWYDLTALSSIRRWGCLRNAGGTGQDLLLTQGLGIKRDTQYRGILEFVNQSWQLFPGGTIPFSGSYTQTGTVKVPYGKIKG